MPEPINTEVVPKVTEDPTPEADNFGVTMGNDGKEISQEETVAKEKEEGGEDKKKDKEGDDIEKNPVVVALRTKLEAYGTNLSGQNDVISKLQDKITKLEVGGGKKDEDGKPEPMFKDIKTSKDLTQEQKDNMTDTEIALFDENALQKEAMNKMFETIANLGKDTKDQKAETEKEKVDDLNSSANAEATKLADEAIKTNPELAKDAKELADKIIVEFKEFNNEGITAEKLIERMKKALNNVSGYTPPKEQENKGGGNNPVKKQNGTGSDPFNVDKEIAKANNNNEGNYTL